MSNSNSQDSSRPKLGGSHHLPPYSTLYGCPWSPHSNDILSRDSQVGVLKLPKLRLSQLWGPITLRADFGLRWSLKQNCSFRQEISSDVLHATCTQWNQVDSWLLMVGNQTANLTLVPSFDRNLCFKCPNGQCEPISNIYVPRAFQLDKKFTIHWVLIPTIALWTFGSLSEFQLPMWELLWECEGLFPHTFLHFPLGPQLCNPLPWLRTQG